MSTLVGLNDPKAVKKWSAVLAREVLMESYFGPKFMGRGENYVIERKTELEADQGDTITFDLSVPLRGTPTEGDATLEGNEEALRFYSDQVMIDQMRHSVDAGGRMTRKRTLHDLRKVCKARLKEYFAELTDQDMFCYISGARGINQDFRRETSWAGRAGNPLQAPDDAHIMFGGAATSKATLTAADKMTREKIEALNTTVSMLRAENPDNANMVPVSVEGGGKHYILLMSKYQAYDLRTATGTGGWLDIQKAATGAEGRNNPIFKGGLGMIGDTVLHEHQSVIRFTDYGAGGNVHAARALMMGRQAAVHASGTGGGNTGMQYSWKEEEKDYGAKLIIACGSMHGCKKTRFKDKDFGVYALDTAARAPSLAAA